MFLLNNTELFLLGITLIGFVILSLYYLIAYARPLRASRRTDDTLEEGNKLPVSIIIYAKMILRTSRNTFLRYLHKITLNIR